MPVIFDKIWPSLEHSNFFTPTQLGVEIFSWFYTLMNNWICEDYVKICKICYILHVSDFKFPFIKLSPSSNTSERTCQQAQKVNECILIEYRAIHMKYAVHLMFLCMHEYV